MPPILRLVSYSTRRGVATHPYPRKPIEVDEFYRGRPVLDVEACIGCGACANACPAETIRVEVDRERGVKRWTIFYGRCIFCGRCHEVCPVNAIHLSREFELASKSREDLMVVAEMKLATCRDCGGYMDYSIRHVMLAQELLKTSSEMSAKMPELSKYTIMCRGCKRSETVRKLAEAVRGWA